LLSYQEHLAYRSSKLTQATHGNLSSSSHVTCLRKYLVDGVPLYRAVVTGSLHVLIKSWDGAVKAGSALGSLARAESAPNRLTNEVFGWICGLAASGRMSLDRDRDGRVASLSRFVSIYGHATTLYSSNGGVVCLLILVG
jgi:hypothetical protein